MLQDGTAEGGIERTVRVGQPVDLGGKGSEALLVGDLPVGEGQGQVGTAVERPLETDDARPPGDGMSCPVWLPDAVVVSGGPDGPVSLAFAADQAAPNPMRRSSASPAAHACSVRWRQRF